MFVGNEGLSKKKHKTMQDERNDNKSMYMQPHDQLCPVKNVRQLCPMEDSCHQFSDQKLLRRWWNAASPDVVTTDVHLTTIHRKERNDNDSVCLTT